MSNPTPHTDIKAKGWIARLPQSWQPYALLMRLDRPIGTWLLLFPAWWSILLSSQALSIETTLKTMILFALGAVIMRGAGCVINDLWDRDFDRMVERTKLRPLARGTISPLHAMIFLCGLLFVSLGILLQFNLLTITLGVLSLIPVILYPLAKRVTWYPQFILGLTFNIGAFMGASAITGTIPLYALFLYIGGIFWTLGYDTIYAQQDIDDDAVIGVKSTALKLSKHLKSWVGGFYTAAYVFFALALCMAAPHSASIPLFIAPLAMCAAHLAWQVLGWTLHDPASCLKIFRSNVWFGWLLLASCSLMLIQ
ncbi:MAG: 4-hydroxybenzoate octaprenyltransferase [Alphaproteobacteria bacterium]|nr:4-hydroxybenzoate octaprenyltransferase [Alphaproteobacteria bacterium]